MFILLSIIFALITLFSGLILFGLYKNESLKNKRRKKDED